LASFTYIGAGTQIATQSDTQAGINLAVMLNQFGRVYNQNWTAGATVLSDNQYLYNNDGMVTYASDSATGLSAAPGSAYGYNTLNQLTQYQRGVVSVSGTGSISGVSETQNLGWNPQGALTYNNVNNVTLLDNLGNAQNQNTSNTYNSSGDAGSSTNAAGEGVNTVYNAWGQPVSYTSNQSIQVGTDSTTGEPIYQTFTQTETIQYDAAGRPLGEYMNVTLPVSGGSPNTQATQHTFVYDANTGEAIQEINQINGSDPVRYVYAPNGNVMVKQAGTGGSTPFNQTLYALQDAQGSTVAITDGTGTILERYAYDGLGNAQALQANGTAYAADANPGSTGTPGQQINEYFVGSTFDSSGTQIADGTQYNWTILYQGENYDALPGVYETANGEFNPRQQSLLAPDLGVIQAGISAYDPLAGETGFQAFLGRHYQGIALGSSVVAGTALSIATWGLATPWVAGALGVEATGLGILGTAAVGAISGAAGGAASGLAYNAGIGASPLQIAESTGENAIFGGATGGVLGAAGFLTPYAGRALAQAGALTGDYMTDFIRAWGMYGRLNLGTGDVYLGSALGGAQGVLERMIWSANAARQAPLMQLAKLPEGQDLSPLSYGNLGQEMHEGFWKALTEATGTKPTDWFDRTPPGMTGIDMELAPNPALAPRLGFGYAELKPLTTGGIRSFLNQLDNWNKPIGQTQLWFYDRTGKIWSTGINF
jgi:hypothetical protein